MTWDTAALQGQACDKFQGIQHAHAEGTKILDEIAKIGQCLDRMDTLTDARIASCNDSCWHPPIDTARIKVLVTVELEQRRDELRLKFNRMFGGER